ncbi:MarR family winged helix-turn-helix transcriptional regulator [Stenotrophomonas acidaminiphila]
MKTHANPDPDLVDQLLADWRHERPDLDAGAMAVVGRVLHLGRLLEARADQCLKPLGLGYTELDLLATLRRSGAPYRLSPTDLRRSVLLTSGAMTACLNRLQARGLIRREPDPHDGRSLLAVLSAKGAKLAERAIALRFAQAREALAGLDAAEQAQLAALLRKLGQGMDAD